MADAKISQLPVGTLTPESIFPIVSEGVTSQITFADIQDAIGTGSSSTKLIVPIGDFLVFKIATGNPNILEVGDMVQGLVEGIKIEAIYTGGTLSALTSFDIINKIIFDEIPEIVLEFGNGIDNAMSALSISDKTNIDDWNTFFNTRQDSVVFDAVEVSGNYVKLIRNSSIFNTLPLNGMFLTNFEMDFVTQISSLNLSNNDLTTIDYYSLPDSMYTLNLSDNNINNFPTSLPLNLTTLDLSGNQIASFDSSVLPSSLFSFTMNDNLLSEFNPSVALPNSLYILSIGENNITTFDPSLALPNNLNTLVLRGNELTYFDPSIALPSNLEVLNLGDNNITTFNPNVALPNTLISLYLNQNQITVFDPSLALPSNLISLVLDNNQLTSIDTTIPLPNSITTLSLALNQFTTFDPVALPTSLKTLYLNQNNIGNFDPSLALPTTLEQLHLSNCQINVFNPSIALPTTLVVLNLSGNALSFLNPSLPLPNVVTIFLQYNPITTSGWNDETAYISSLPNNGTFNATSTSDTIIGTTTQTLLQGKGWTIQI